MCTTFFFCIGYASRVANKFHDTLGRPSAAELQTTLRGSSSLRWTRVCSLRDEHLSALKKKCAPGVLVGCFQTRMVPPNHLF